MIYTNTQATFGMTSTWQCYFYVANGGLQWYITDTPTSARHTVTFPLDLPADAVVTRAWLTMGLTEPISGSAVRKVNGQPIPSSGEVEVEGITAETTSFEAVFAFRANGIVFQDTQVHSGRLTINDPTLHVEYVAASDPDEPTEDEVIISRPLDTGVQLPRLLDSNFREVSRIDPDNLRLSLKLNPLSTAVMRIPPGEPSVKVKDFLELFSPHGSAGIFRVTEVETAYGYNGGQTVYLEHAFGTLADSLAIGVQAMSAPVATVFSTLLANQNEYHWSLGDCEVPEDYELIYEYSYDNLLQAIVSLTSMLPDEYAWEFDTLQHPFIMHLRRMPDDASCECRLSRNLTTATLTIDTSDLCTRLYPFGAGEGTDRMTLANLVGSQYIDSANIDVWGLVSRTFTAENIFDALTLRDVAQRYLARHDHPTVSVTLDAMDLYEATGESIDMFRLGRRCRLALPDYGVTMYERVIVTEWADVYSQPDRVEVTLANRLRDASDEIAELMREATSSKLLGGSVETIEASERAGNITPGSPFEHDFEVKGYGNVLNVKTSYSCKTSAGIDVDCSIRVDGNDVDTTAAQARVVDITRYLATDDNGVVTVGNHRVRLSPKTLNDTVSTVDNTITIKQISKR